MSFLTEIHDSWDKEIKINSTFLQANTFTFQCLQKDLKWSLKGMGEWDYFTQVLRIMDVFLSKKQLSH